ncbi:MAG: helix-turn-helix domain-containing GNAT family N-acetyltransferase [Sphingomonadales bacterium]|jgi:DNA-binding MarR family transcriptional regulator/GNAT superfamily N-acetyltransferase
MKPPVDIETITAVRQFNRFHTQLVGALNERLLASDYSLPQARLLYEIAHTKPDRPPSAREVGNILRMDAGYLSRIVSGLESQGLIERTPSPENAKRLALTLTDRGREVSAKLDAASAEEVSALLAPLSEIERRQLVGAMHRIRRVLGDISNDRTFILRDPESGDLGWITHKQGILYAKEFDWDWTYEALVAEIVGQFAKDFIPGKEKCWIAEREGEIVGSVFLVRQDDKTAKLRLLYVDEAARGLGLGRRLVDECIRFARACGYKRMTLWTTNAQASARRIYEATGFKRIEEKPRHMFGKDVIGETWAMDL